jgi:NAD(P)-dependent dehydrogenase (short-subunit alcohol dehydrogenase family)
LSSEAKNRLIERTQMYPINEGSKQKLLELEGKVAIVTGAAQGIGRAVANLLSDRGARVVINDISDEAAIAASNAICDRGGEAIPVLADVTDPRAVEELIRTAVSVFSRVDILVNNAGVLRPTRLPLITEQEWDLVVNSNLKSTFLCSQAVLPHFISQRYGRIVNLSSTAGKSVSTLGGVHYTAAKAGILGLTRAFAKEMAPHNIRVNAVCPGLVNTEMVQRNISPEQLSRFVDAFPISRICEPSEVAELIFFLVSDKANYITGAAFDINGGDLMV